MHEIQILGIVPDYVEDMRKSAVNSQNLFGLAQVLLVALDNTFNASVRIILDSALSNPSLNKGNVDYVVKSTDMDMDANSNTMLEVYAKYIENVLCNCVASKVAVRQVIVDGAHLPTYECLGNKITLNTDNAANPPEESDYGVHITLLDIIKNNAQKKYTFVLHQWGQCRRFVECIA